MTSIQVGFVINYFVLGLLSALFILFLLHVP